MNLMGLVTHLHTTNNFNTASPIQLCAKDPFGKGENCKKFAIY